MKVKLEYLMAIIIVFTICNIHAQTLDQSNSLMNSLTNMNTISVTIGGAFITNGTFSSYASERLDQFVTRIFNEQKAVLLSAAKDRNTYRSYMEEFDNYAERDIKLKRMDGTEINIDLKKFRLTGNFEHNPYLKEGDVIIFPIVDLETSFIEISGAVNRFQVDEEEVRIPYRFQFVEGDNLEDAFLFARGINRAYEEVDSVEISRLSYDGKFEQIFKVTVEENFSLQNGDRIRVLANGSQRKAFKVYVEGEVEKPGYIYVTKNNTTIKEVILKTGGFKSSADLARAELIRGSNVYNSPIFSEQFDLMLMQRMSNIDLEDSVSFLVDNRLRFSRGSGTIDFTRVMKNSTEDSEFIVKDGDYIFIPEIVNLVYVFGQVGTPGYVDYAGDRTYQYFIDRAGGLGTTARGEVYLIKGKTRTWIELTEEESEYTIEPGDFIWVPKAPYRTFDYYLNRVGSVAAIVGSITTVILLFIQVLNN